MKAKVLVILSTLMMALTLMAQSATQTPTAPTGDQAKSCACCNHDQANGKMSCCGKDGCCCKDGKCDMMSTDSKDGMKCPMMSKGNDGKMSCCADGKCDMVKDGKGKSCCDGMKCQRKQAS